MSLEEHQQLRERTKQFALRIIRMADLLPHTRSANVMANQVLRSATSVTANYRAAGRSRSKAEYVAKIGVVVERQTKHFVGWSFSRRAIFCRQVS